MISYAQVIIHSQSQSLKQLQFIITSERVYVRAFQQVHILNYHLVFHNC